MRLGYNVRATPSLRHYDALASQQQSKLAARRILGNKKTCRVELPHPPIFGDRVLPDSTHIHMQFLLHVIYPGAGRQSNCSCLVFVRHYFIHWITASYTYLTLQGSTAVQIVASIGRILGFLYYVWFVAIDNHAENPRCARRKLVGS